MFCETVYIRPIGPVGKDRRKMKVLQNWVIKGTWNDT